MIRQYYRVGGHLFALNIPHESMFEKELISYSPFQTVPSIDSSPLFTLTFTTELNIPQSNDEKTVDLEDENGRMTLSYVKDGSLSVLLNSPSGVKCCRLLIDKDCSMAQACFYGNGPMVKYAFDTALMLLYTFASAGYETLLLHASVIVYDNSGLIFLGKSGTGKSTHSCLWIENVAGARLLNDDNPVVRIIDGDAWVYGSPWSGKTPCHINEAVKLKALVRLHQAPYNKINMLTGVKAYGAVITSCSFMKWNHEMCDSIHQTVRRLLDSVKTYELFCLPDADSVKECKYGIIDNN